MDLLTILGGSLVGQILHVVKKRTEGKEETESELDVFLKWVVRRPLSTISAAIVAFATAAGVNMGIESALTTQMVAAGATAGTVAQVPGLLQFFQAVLAGIAGNSAINRPGVNHVENGP